jgi:hypothetical protein
MCRWQRDIYQHPFYAETSPSFGSEDEIKSQNESSEYALRTTEKEEGE